MVILESDDGAIYHDNKRGIWCQSLIDKENEDIIIRNMSGEEYETYDFETWSDRGPSNMELYDRFSKVSSRVIKDPGEFLTEELFEAERPDPRKVDVKYASLLTGRDVSFFWERRQHATDTYSDRVPDFGEI